MKKKYIPYIIGVPNLGVGLLWAMNMLLIPILAATITKSYSKLAILTSMGAFTGIFVQYLAGIISDRSNFKMGRRKPFIIIGSLFATVFICIMPFTKNYTLLFIVAFLFYFSLNFYQGPYYSLIPESVDDNQLGLANGFSRVISVLGMALIFTTGTSLWDKNHALPFLLAAALALISVMITVIFVKEDPCKYSKPTKLSFDFIKFPSAMKLYFSVFFIFLSYGCITPFIVRYCVDGLNFTEGNASTGLLVLTLVGALFAYPVGMLADKIEKRKVLLAGVIILTICLALAPLAKSLFGMNAMFSFFGVGFIAIQITSYAIVAEIVPPERLGEFMGILNLFISLSQFLANNIMGNILDKFGFSLFFPIPCIAMLIAVVIIFFSKFEKYNVSAVRDKQANI